MPLWRARSIPTCVGTTAGPPGGPHGLAVHPHVRGDYRTGEIIIAAIVGPSPRAWGLRAYSGSWTRAQRSIPTCVGTTPPLSPPPAPPPVHPHVRGDYLAIRLMSVYSVGPSPRAWGLPPWPPGAPTWVRSIPTCVGTTQPTAPHEAHGRVHPHVRGDYVVPRGAGFHQAGPSPRAWGLLRPPIRCGSGYRSIPTCVGTTPRSRTIEGRPGVHPHVRGDYLWPFFSVTVTRGPSPRAWGLQHGGAGGAPPHGPSPRAWGLLLMRRMA